MYNPESRIHPLSFSLSFCSPLFFSFTWFLVYSGLSFYPFKFNLLTKCLFRLRAQLTTGHLLCRWRLTAHAQDSESGPACEGTRSACTRFSAGGASEWTSWTTQTRMRSPRHSKQVPGFRLDIHLIIVLRVYQTFNTI